MTKEQHLEAAEHLIHFEKIALSITNSKACIVMYKGKPHIGSYQEIVPNHPEVVLVAHSSYPVEMGLVDALNELSPRETLSVDPVLELAHRQDILQKIGLHLTRLTPAQTIMAEVVIGLRGIIEL